jgi:Mg2+-importing ATPase
MVSRNSVCRAGAEVIGVVAVGAVLPSTPLAHALGFQALPGDFFIALAALALAYLVVIELGKRAFYGAIPAQSAPDKRALGDGRRYLRRRAAHLGHAPAGFAASTPPAVRSRRGPPWP